MATYTITTKREQEAGLNYIYDKYKVEDQTKEQFLQDRVSHQVLNPMVTEWKRDQSVSLDLSIATIPEANESKASQEIQNVIIANGGTIVTNPTPTPPGVSTRIISAPGGTTSNPIQVGGTATRATESSRPDGESDK